jgi:hypothetical protein
MILNVICFLAIIASPLPKCCLSSLAHILIKVLIVLLIYRNCLYILAMTPLTYVFCEYVHLVCNMTFNFLNELYCKEELFCFNKFEFMNFLLR